MSLEPELRQARELSVAGLADAIESTGLECTRSGACCKAVETHEGDREKHTATDFPDEVRRLGNAANEARPGGARPADGRRRRPRGPGRAIDRRDAEDLAAALKERAVRELEAAIAVQDAHRPRPEADGIVVHDSEGPRRPDGMPLNGR